MQGNSSTLKRCLFAELNLWYTKPNKVHYVKAWQEQHKDVSVQAQIKLIPVDLRQPETKGRK